MGDVKARIAARAAALGFDAVGFCRAEISAAQREGLRDYLAAGHHGDMKWMAARAEQRGDPKALWPDVKTVISVGMSYAPQGDALAGLAEKSAGNISVYARGRDYHEVVKGKLKHLAQFVAAGEAYESGVARARELAVSGRGFYDAGDRAGCGA